jgi:DNA-directed RNA polymerase subunit RPC12/RpoP
MIQELKAQDKNGQNRCPNCGATETKLIKETGLLQCKYCRTQFKGIESNALGGVEELQGKSVGEGAADIIPSENEILTFKCPSCGAEIVINANEATSARCHWCRHVFSLNEKMPNGAVPDLVLPFKLEKAVAEQKIRDFVGKRQFFAHPQFKKEFTTENVMGVYLPYMIVDVNAHAVMSGEAEHLVRKYTVDIGKTKTT